MRILLWGFCAILGYLLGNFSTGTFLSKRTVGKDIRQYGSGSAGATNMLRVLGKRPALYTFLGDLLKGLLGAFVGWLIAGRDGALIGGFFAVVGHIWPVFYGFHGGKGVSTSIGAILFVMPWYVLLLAAIAIPLILLTRYVSLADIVAALVYGIVVCITSFGSDWMLFFYGFFLSGIVIFAHRANIDRLRKGTENRLELSAFSGKGK